jgi:hypothetical protein
MRTKTARRVTQVLVATMTVVVAGAVTTLSAMADPIPEGTCYRVSYEDGSPNPPSVTVCPFD